MLNSSLATSFLKWRAGKTLSSKKMANEYFCGRKSSYTHKLCPSCPWNMIKFNIKTQITAIIATNNNPKI